MASILSCPRPSGSGQPSPAALALANVSSTVVCPMFRLRAMLLELNPASYRNLNTSIILRMDTLRLGTVAGHLSVSFHDTAVRDPATATPVPRLCHAARVEQALQARGGGRFRPERVPALLRNQWQDCVGIIARFRSEWVPVLARNTQCSADIGSSTCVWVCLSI